MINEATLTAGDDDPVTDDELLYRRIPESTGWYDPRTGTVNPEAFAPHKEHDRTGLSVTRAKYRGSSYNEAMRGRSGKTYYVAVLRVGDLRKHGIQVIARPETPDGFDPAHAELPQLTSATRKSEKTLEQQRVLATHLCLRVDGPFTVP